jgi:transcriptional regulator with XRE-family HTH domain
MVMKLKDSVTVYAKKKAWSISRLAKESGVPVQTIHGWTVGRKPVNLDQLKKVASALQISIHQLVFGEPDPFESQGEEILKEIFSGDVRVTLHRIERKRR